MTTAKISNTISQLRAFGNTSAARTLTEVAAEREELLEALLALRRNVDVSTINNSKRSTERWEQLVAQADAAIVRAQS